MDFHQQYTDFQSVFKKNISQAVKIILKNSLRFFGDCFVVVMIIFNNYLIKFIVLNKKIPFN